MYKGYIITYVYVKENVIFCDLLTITFKNIHSLNTDLSHTTFRFKIVNKIIKLRFLICI